MNNFPRPIRRSEVTPTSGRWFPSFWRHLAIGLLVAGSTSAQADKLDEFIQAAMEKRAIPGLSLAVLQDGAVVKAQGYGMADQAGNDPVTTATLFQAGSVSKSVAALGALRLVEEKKLSLDEDVNDKLVTWKVPENKFTKAQKVTLRRLLSHSAGLTVHGFPGYAVGKPVPTLVQVLEGASPANTSAIRVDFEPGSKLRYSGGGYTVMQQLIVDVTREPFDRFMQQAVLNPLKMTNSSYAQPLPAEQAALAATGYYSGGKAVEGKWHLYPEMAAAGLWTTASDLAQFALAIQQTIAGSTNGIIPPSMARQMVTNQSESDGLGVFLLGEGQTQRFVHNGRDEGFDAILMAYAHRGQGVVVLINANDNTGALTRIVEAVAHAYHWPDFK
jgi:CubicO group peptidase (beta-lactamase class C family)